MMENAHRPRAAEYLCFYTGAASHCTCISACTLPHARSARIWRCALRARQTASDRYLRHLPLTPPSPLPRLPHRGRPPLPFRQTVAGRCGCRSCCVLKTAHPKRTSLFPAYITCLCVASTRAACLPTRWRSVRTPTSIICTAHRQKNRMPENRTVGGLKNAGIGGNNGI